MLSFALGRIVSFVKLCDGHAPIDSFIFLLCSVQLLRFMECHANEGYNPVDEDVGQRGCCSAEDIPEKGSDGSNVRVAFDATNRGFVDKEDDLTSLPVENPVGNTVPDESDSHPMPNPVENEAFDESVLSEVDSKVTSTSPPSFSTLVASHIPQTDYPPSRKASSSVSQPSASSHLPLPEGVTASSQLRAHRMISPIILSPSLPPVAQSSNLVRNREKSKDANVFLNWNSPSEQDHDIQTLKESGGASAAPAEYITVVDGDTEAVATALPFPEPETIGGRCRIDSTCDEEFRLVSKCGRRHVYSKVSLATRCLQYTRDIFTTMVDMEWKYHLVIWMASFCITWVGFGILWWFTIPPNYVVDDYYDPSESNASQTTNSTTYSIRASPPASSPSPSPSSCLEKVQDIAGAILFSIETQTTIGYGVRYIRSDCHPLAYILFFVQILSGVCIAFFLSGVIFRKLSRPYGRASTILFSRYAVIRLNDAGSDYCLEFRMGDIRRSHIIGTSIRALMVKDRLTSEGERIPLCQYPLHLDTQSSVTDSFVFMPWPIIVSHRIDAESPLWTVSRRNLREERFEIIVMFEGVVESTGASTQFRTSYLPSEVIWGNRFASLPILEKTGCDGHTPSFVDFRDFEQTVPVEMDDRCAKDFTQDRKRLGQGLDAVTERRNTGTAEHRVPGTVKPRETGTSLHENPEEIRYTTTEATKVVVADIDHSFHKMPASLEDLALRLQRRVQKKAKRRQSVKPQPTQSAIRGEGLAVNGRNLNKSYTY